MQYKPQEEIEIEGDLKSLEEMMVQLIQDHWKQEEEIVTKFAWREGDQSGVHGKVDGSAEEVAEGVHYLGADAESHRIGVVSELTTTEKKMWVYEK